MNVVTKKRRRRSLKTTFAAAKKRKLASKKMASTLRVVPMPLRTVTATAARSPGRRSATFLPARSACSRGRWASRSPTVSIPSEASAWPALPGSVTGSLSRLGRGNERSSASSFSSSVLAKAVAMCR